MSGVEIVLICGVVVSTVGSLVAIFRKNIRRSKCFGNEIVFRGDTTVDHELKPEEPVASPTIPARNWDIMRLPDPHKPEEVKITITQV